MNALGLISACCVLFTMAVPICAGMPTDQVKATTDRIITILNDAGLKGDPRKAERRHLIRAGLDERFDWATISRGSLGRHWSKLSREQQKEFMDLFSRFLEQTYLDKIEPAYSDLDKVEYQAEKIIDNYASVKTVIITKEKVRHPVEYRLQKPPAGNHWRVYDLIIEGVSLVKNYRQQFDEIMARSSYENLIKDIRAKFETNTNTPAGAAK